MSIDSISSLFNKVIKVLIKNKVLIMVALFFVYLFFFDEYNLTTRFKVAQTNRRLTEQKETYINLINFAKQDKIDLENNYEKFAREKFKMSKADEDVFIIETKKLKEK